MNFSNYSLIKRVHMIFFCYLTKIYLKWLYSYSHILTDKWNYWMLYLMLKTISLVLDWTPVYVLTRSWRIISHLASFTSCLIAIWDSLLLIVIIVNRWVGSKGDMFLYSWTTLLRSDLSKYFSCIATFCRFFSCQLFSSYDLWINVIQLEF